MFKTLNVKTASVIMRVFVFMKIFFEENNKVYFYSWLSYVMYFTLFWVSFWLVYQHIVITPSLKELANSELLDFSNSIRKKNIL